MNRWHSLPAEVYSLVECTPATVLLESSPSDAAASTSQLFTAPLRVLAARELAELPGLFAQIESAIAEGHFAAGYFAYECGQAFEPTAGMRTGPAGFAGDSASSLARQPNQPLAWFGIYERAYLFDHRTGVFIDGAPCNLLPVTTPQLAPPLISLALTAEQYARRIHAIHEWIRAGDIYQLNFTFPLHARIADSPAALYARLRTRQPVKYGAFLHCEPGRHILCFSPELFFRLEEQGATRRITARPMKGTARRGRTTGEDRQIAEWLRNDPKNRAENVMIVDLIRNDLGRLCTFGSVRVQSLFAAERYRTLWQMTSTATGELRSDVSFEQIFRALFPCGSVTGAPKVRAMQLLAQIEDEPRGVYTGAIGYFSRQKTLFNVAIRTLEMEGQNARMGVGSGIVIDSDTADEFRECQLKAEFLTRSEEPFSLIETLLWQGCYPLIELHLDRLEDSASYFGFACDRTAAKAALLAASAAFVDIKPRKVRLLANADGTLHIEHEALPEGAAASSTQPGRVRIAPQRTDPHDRFLFHKTTHRPLYARAFQAAKEAGFDDVLFFNTHGQVTEGAISNIFIEQSGRWFTPPVSCGLLAGVYRRHLLETLPGAEERILSQEDLKAADAVYLTNAVRGLRRVIIDWENLPSGTPVTPA
jgi:para-aminobenzoate synthetase/4-amino-4-deoxychorismate lyase